MLAELVPVGSFESLYSVVGIALLIICFALVFIKKFAGWCTVLTILCLGACWVGIERGSSAENIKTTQGYGILWKWENGTFHDEPQWGWDSIESLYEKAKKERYYAMHVNGSVSPQWFHPDSLWVAPLIVVVLGVLVCPSLWPVIFMIVSWLVDSK